jgi:hypothetical protein
MGTPRYTKHKKWIEQFLSDVIDPTKCAIWPFKKNAKGYAKTYLLGKYLSVHRIVFERFYGCELGALLVRHKCDNPSCVNPHHLEAGTDADNVRDRDVRGRTARLFGDRNPAFGKPCSPERKQHLSQRMSGARNPFFGRTHSDATRLKMSEARSGLIS